MIHPARLIPWQSLIGALKAREEQGLVNSQRAEGHNLTIWSYSRKCVYEAAWDNITLLARGLVLDEHTGTVEATPFLKFFNHGEAANSALPNLPFESYTKMDGSLIICFWYKDRWWTATKGSFQSPQAQLAQKHLPNMDAFTPGDTYLFELIGPSNKIVVPYIDDRLVLLSAYKQNGEEYSYVELARLADQSEMLLVTRHLFSSLSEMLALQPNLPAQYEGFVVRFSDGHRLKIKGDEYCRLHRIVAGITPLALWEAMHDQVDMEELRKTIPEEFWGDFDNIRSVLQGQLDYLLEHVRAEALAASDWTDKELGLRLKTLPIAVQPFIFTLRRKGHLLTDRRARYGLFQQIRPKHNHLLGYVPSSSMRRVQEDALS